MRRDRKKKIRFDGGDFSLIELEGKTVKSVINLLLEQREHSDTVQEEWESSQRGKQAAQKEVKDMEGQRNELQSMLDKLETVIRFRLETVFDNYDYHDSSDDFPHMPTTKSQVRERPEEESVLKKLLSMATNVNFKRSY